MATLKIRLIPDPVLRQEAAPVEQFDAKLQQLTADMIETMHAAPGVGLAAPQIGVSARVAVVDVSVGEDPEALLVLINPEILERSGIESDVEGCLSIPEITEKVNRSTWLRVKAQDLDGAGFEFEAEDFTARAIQHEIDHLDGILFIDRLRGLRRERVRRQVKKLLASTETSTEDS